ncbi:MAG: hypothetical protein D6772_03700, partial [Bacteroidetes bacterium]
SIDFTKSLQTIKETAKVINKQVTKAAGEVQADLFANGEQLVDLTTKTVKDTLGKVDLKVKLEQGVESLKTATQKANTLALETADDLAEGIYTNGKQWQKLAEKAIDGSLKLAAKQQDLIFDTLEAMKKQMATGAKRFTKLFSVN